MKIKAAKHLDLKKNATIWNGTEIINEKKQKDNLNDTFYSVCNTNKKCKNTKKNKLFASETEEMKEIKNEKDKRKKKNEKRKKKKRYEKFAKPKKKKRKTSKILDFNGLDIDNDDDQDIIIDKLQETMNYLIHKKNRNKKKKRAIKYESSSDEYQSSSDQYESSSRNDEYESSDEEWKYDTKNRKRKRKLK